MVSATYADILRPAARRQAYVYDGVLIVAASLLLALSAQLAIRLPFSPVPVTAQTLVVLLVGLLLGSRRGALAVLAYLGEGLAGLPVFAGAGFGLPHLLGPTGGYLIGFVAAAYLTGRLAERGWDRRVPTTLLALVLGNLAIYAFGVSWLAIIVGVQRALVLGLYPFVPGDLAKIVLASLLLPAGWRLLGRG